MIDRRTFVSRVALLPLIAPVTPTRAPSLRAEFASVRYRDVSGYRMAYREVGEGSPIVFLHGNPTSSWLWRHVAPPLSTFGRCIAPDLLGMGSSAKAAEGRDRDYEFEGQRRYLDELLGALGVTKDVVLVCHDWGTALAFDWARRHPWAVKGICHMEGFVEPLSSATMSEAFLGFFRFWRTAEGEAAALDRNEFLERAIIEQLGDRLTDEDRRIYREPFRRPGRDRLPTLTWPRQVPFDGQPASVLAILESNWHWMSRSAVPKLFIDAEPGGIVQGRRKHICLSWPLTTTAPAKSRHYVPEEDPAAIVAALQAWLPRLAGSPP